MSKQVHEVGTWAIFIGSTDMPSNYECSGGAMSKHYRYGPVHKHAIILKKSSRCDVLLNGFRDLEPRFQTI